MAQIPIFTEARKILLADGVVGIPTETVYGLAAPITNASGLRKIFTTKERPLMDPLIVHISAISQVRGVAREFPQLAEFLAQQFWPGPLTMVLPKDPALNPLITAGLDTVALRMPKHTLALDFIQFVGIPLAAPSANKFTKTSPTSAAHVRQNFPELFVIDGGECSVGIESTVIVFARGRQGEEIHILRPGAITEGMLQAAVAEWKNPVRILSVQNSQQSPGQMQEHYRPDIPLVILNRKAFASLPIAEKNRMVAARGLMDNARGIELLLDPDPLIAARLLYSQLYELAHSTDYNYIFILDDPERRQGVWTAIWDRLQRAASLRLE